METFYLINNWQKHGILTTKQSEFTFKVEMLQMRSSTRKQRKGRVFESHANKCTNVNLEQYVQDCTVLIVCFTEYNHIIWGKRNNVAYLNTY